MKLTPKPQPQKEQPATTPPVPDLAATVADLLNLTMQLVNHSADHSAMFIRHGGWIAEHELRLRELDGATTEAPAVPPTDDAARNSRAMIEAIQRLGERIGKDLDYHFNRVTVRLEQ